MKRYELTKEHWEQVKAVLPPERTGKRGRPRKDDRRMHNGMLWITHSRAAASLAFLRAKTFHDIGRCIPTPLMRIR